MNFLFLVLALLTCNLATASIPNEKWTYEAEESHVNGYNNGVMELFEPYVGDSIPSVDKFSPSWPIKENFPTVLGRFGTLVTLETEIAGGITKFAYTHDALDIARSHTSISDEVLAPVSGLAIVFSDGDGQEDYLTSVAILDEESKLVVVMVHLHPSERLGRNEMIRVNRGEIIGRLVKVDFAVDPILREKFKHTHLSVIDVKNKKLINPNNSFPFYRDTIPPQVEEIELFDEKGLIQKNLVSGEVDLAVTTFDRDNFSGLNSEIASFATTVKDGSGKILLEIKNCNLDFLTDSLTYNGPLRDAFYLDFIGSFKNIEFGFASNASVNDRKFSYAISNFQENPNGCSLKKDKNSYIRIDDSMSSIEVHVQVVDHNNNRKSLVKKFFRE